MPLSVATSKKLVGVWPDVLTPLQPNLGIDLPKMASHIRNLAVKGVEHVTLFGYAGEGASFAADEKLEALAYLLKSGVEGPDIVGRELVVAGGCGSSDSASACPRCSAILGISATLLPALEQQCVA